MQALGDFFGVALVVEGEEAVEDLAAGGFGNSEADALFGFVEVVAEVEVGPVIGAYNRRIHLLVQSSEMPDILRFVAWNVKSVVDLR